MDWFPSIDWPATGVLLLTLWQALKEFRTRSVTKANPKAK